MTSHFCHMARNVKYARYVKKEKDAVKETAWVLFIYK